MKKNIIVVDLMGVLFLLNKGRIVRQLGLCNLIKFYIKFHKNPLDHCLSLLDTMRLQEPGEFQEIVAYKNFYLPESLCLWQKGLLTNEQALEKITRYFNSVALDACYDRKVVMHIAHIVFSAQQLILALDLNVNFFKQLVAAKNKYRVFLLSNIDRESWSHIEKNYAEIVRIFDGIVLSSNVNLLKPDRLIFDYLLDTYQLNPGECIFIDDQIENCTTAKMLGMNSIIYSIGQDLRL